MKPSHRIDVPRFEDLISNPDLSNEALKGLVIEYEKKRQRLEDDLSKYKKQYSKLKEEMTMVQSTSVVAGSGDKKDSNDPDLNLNLIQLKGERDRAIDMWRMSEKLLAEFKSEVSNNRADVKLNYLMREMDRMQLDYSDAITLLENKLEEQRKEIDQLIVEREKSSKELELCSSRVQSIRQEMCNLEESLSKSETNREEISTALDKCLERLNQSKQWESEARQKIEDAIEMTQQALAAHNMAADENEHLKSEINHLHGRDLVEKEELEKVKADVKTAVKEKEQLIEEFEEIKLSCYNKLEEVITKNKTLTAQLKDYVERKYMDRIQWNEERKMLRLQIVTLQESLENINHHLREGKYPRSCKKCADAKRKMDKYKKNVRRWRRRAEGVRKILLNKDLVETH